MFIDNSNMIHKHNLWDGNNNLVIKIKIKDQHHLINKVCKYQINLLFKEWVDIKINHVNLNINKLINHIEEETYSIMRKQKIK